MPTNKFFNNYYSKTEQKLVNGLIEESIQIYGADVYYLPRTLGNYDPIYGADTVSEYNNNFPIEMYVRDVNSYSPPGEWMSKFGIEFRDDITFSISLRSFEKNVIQYNSSYVRPQESDLIYVPFLSRIFIIKYADYKPSPAFFQFGKVFFYDLKCEVWEYSSEVLNTGIPEIDNIQMQYTTDLQAFQILTQDPSYFLADSEGYALICGQFDFSAQNALEDNDALQTEANTVIDWSETNPFGEN